MPTYYCEQKGSKVVCIEWKETDCNEVVLQALNNTSVVALGDTVYLSINNSTT